MKKIIVFVSLLALLLGSCAGEEEKAEETPPPQPTEATADAEAEAQESETVDEAREAQPTVPGLIPATKAEDRRQGIIAGRSDPFAIIPVQPKIVVANDGTGQSRIGPQIPEPPPLPLEPDGTDGTDGTIEGEAVVKADLAEKVVISGVIDLGDVTQIIINAPNEPYTRYVQPGQYVANGEVLVKRVEMGLGAAPIIVLEQSGIEVFKPVGSEAQPEEETTVLLPDS